MVNAMHWNLRQCVIWIIDKMHNITLAIRNCHDHDHDNDGHMYVIQSYHTIALILFDSFVKHNIVHYTWMNRIRIRIELIDFNLIELNWIPRMNDMYKAYRTIQLQYVVQASKQKESNPNIICITLALAYSHTIQSVPETASSEENVRSFFCFLPSLLTDMDMDQVLGPNKENVNVNVYVPVL